MNDILIIVLPVFIVLGFGYLARWRNLIKDSDIDGLMTFTQGFAIPCLLFRAISTLDLGETPDLNLLISYYCGAITAFALGMIGARALFARSWQDSVAIGFCALFSNTVLLGLPITERAFGADALIGNYTIIAFHAPFGYLLGITAMEIVRANGTALTKLPAKVGRAIFANALIWGILLGAVVNLANITLPLVLTDAIDLMVGAALPAALFGLGGVLFRYRPEGDMRTILFVCALSLGVHPLITYSLSTSLGISPEALRSAVITASVAPGINTYVFANMYNSAKRVAASAVLIGTAFSVLTTTVWLSILP